MPTRSLSSPVLKWPDRQSVDRAVRRWAENVVQQRQDVVRIGYFGSYARGDWGVGSDLAMYAPLRRIHSAFQRQGVLFLVSTSVDRIHAKSPVEVRGPIIP